LVLPDSKQVQAVKANRVNHIPLHPNAIAIPGTRHPVRPQYTDHCFTGDYPTHLTDTGGDTKAQLSLLAEAS
jgi:hypothetical protein